MKHTIIVVEETYQVPQGQYRGFRWKCSCGARGRLHKVDAWAWVEEAGEKHKKRAEGGGGR